MNAELWAGKRRLYHLGLSGLLVRDLRWATSPPSAGQWGPKGNMGGIAGDVVTSPPVQK